MYINRRIPGRTVPIYTIHFGVSLHLVQGSRKYPIPDIYTTHDRSGGTVIATFFLAIKIMYLEIDFTQTFQKLREHFIAANLVLKVQRPREYRKLSLKSTHMETMKEIIRFYAAYLHKNKIYQLEESRRFWITNTAIAKYKLQHSTTIYRHIEVLIQAGIIQSKVFHGSNCGLEIELNRKVLAFKKQEESGRLWIQQELFKEETKKHQTENGEEETILATCKDNDSGDLQETYNLNMSGEDVEKQETKGQKQGSRAGQYFEEKGKRTEPDTSHPGAAGNIPELAQYIDYYTSQAWQFARSVLYPKEQFSQKQEVLTLFYIRDYFALVKAESFTRSHVDKLFHDFCQRILLARKYLDKSPERFIPVPWSYFDKHFESGFKGTMHWLKKVKEKRRQLKSYYGNLSDFSKHYRNYLTSPTLAGYRQAEAAIKKKADPKLLEIYYTCVGTPRKYSPEFLHQYYQQLKV